MDYRQRTTRRLHEEHESTFAACARLEGALARLRTAPPTSVDPAWTTVFAPFARQLSDEVFRHFEFEEASLFPLLAAAGEGDVVGLLLEEHATIRECADAFLSRLPALRGGIEDVAGWRSFRTTALELTERLVGHAQKEEMAMLPALDDTLDDQQDNDLYTAYVGG